MKADKTEEVLPNEDNDDPSNVSNNDGSADDVLVLQTKKKDSAELVTPQQQQQQQQQLSYSCYVCDLVFPCQSDFSDHQKSAHNIVVGPKISQQQHLRCTLCNDDDARFEDKSAGFSHVKSAHLSVLRINLEVCDVKDLVDSRIPDVLKSQSVIGRDRMVTAVKARLKELNSMRQRRRRPPEAGTFYRCPVCDFVVSGFRELFNGHLVDHLECRINFVAAKYVVELRGEMVGWNANKNRKELKSGLGTEATITITTDRASSSSTTTNLTGLSEKSYASRKGRPFAGPREPAVGADKLEAVRHSLAVESSAASSPKKNLKRKHSSLNEDDNDNFKRSPGLSASKKPDQVTKESVCIPGTKNKSAEKLQYTPTVFSVKSSEMRDFQEAGQSLDLKGIGYKVDNKLVLKQDSLTADSLILIPVDSRTTTVEKEEEETINSLQSSSGCLETPVRHLVMEESEIVGGREIVLRSEKKVVDIVQSQSNKVENVDEENGEGQDVSSKCTKNVKEKRRLKLFVDDEKKPKKKVEEHVDSVIGRTKRKQHLRNHAKEKVREDTPLDVALSMLIDSLEEDDDKFRCRICPKSAVYDNVSEVRNHIVVSHLRGKNVNLDGPRVVSSSVVSSNNESSASSSIVKWSFANDKRKRIELFSCDRCDDCTNLDEDEVRRHVLKSHSREMRPLEKFYCSHCEFVSPNKKSWEQHCKECLNLKKVPKFLPVALFVVEDRVNLAHNCKRDTLIVDLDEGMRKMCNLCWKDFDSRDDAEEHLLKMHWLFQEGYECVKCGFKSKCLKTMNQHLSKCSSTKCPKCKFVSKDDSVLTRHIREKHKRKPTRKKSSSKAKKEGGGAARKILMKNFGSDVVVVVSKNEESKYYSSVDNHGDDDGVTDPLEITPEDVGRGDVLAKEEIITIEDELLANMEEYI